MTKATVPLARHREVRDKLAAAQTELRAVQAQRDELRGRVKALGEQLQPLVTQLSQAIGENRTLKAMIVKIHQQATSAGADLPKLETYQSIPEGTKHGQG